MANLNFEGENTRYGVHALHPYAAKCPPQLVRYGLRYYSRVGDTVLDPMVGSGTTLAEARRLGRNAIGYDIDPLARLIAAVKLGDVSDRQIEKGYNEVADGTAVDLNALKSRRAAASVKARANLPDFQNRDYWFDRNVAVALALLGYHIASIPAVSVRRFLWVAFSSIILAKKSVANARGIIHSRDHYVEHDAQLDVLARFKIRVEQMRKRMDEFRMQCQTAPKTKCFARMGDARRLPQEDESVDLVFFSPPYATALDYPRAHFLSVAWMEKAPGTDLAEYRDNAGNYVGSNRGGARGFKLHPSLELHEISALEKRSARQASVIQRYFLDMSQVLSEAARVLKRGCHALIVICPSHIQQSWYRHRCSRHRGRIHRNRRPHR
jgi:DNA modification methylase